MIDVSKFLKWESTRKGARITSCVKQYQGALAIPSTLDGQPVCAIGDGAFSNCSDLTSVVMPPSVAELGRHAFEQCRALESVELSSQLVEIPFRAFKSCSKLAAIKFPQGLLGIDAEAFARCSSLETVVVNDRLVRIGASAFERCLQLKSFILPDHVVEVGAKAFKDCVSLELFVIPERVETLGDGFLAGCASLMDVKLFTGNAHFSRSQDGALFSKDRRKLIFYPCGRKDESYTIPEETLEIGPMAFEGVTALSSIEFHDGAITIGDAAFRKCTGLESLELGANTRSLGVGAFQDCSSIRRIKFPNKLTEIADEAFSGCSSLVELRLPPSVQRIGDGAFEDCSSLPEIILTDGVKVVGKNAFNGCALLRKLTIPSSVETLGDSAFEDCANEDPPSAMRKVEIPEGPREIGAWCFSDISYLEYVSIPASVEKIGTGAFAFCNGLQVVDVDNDNQHYSAYEGALYSRDGATLYAYPAGRSAKTFALPEWCRIVGPSAFALSSNLQEITLHPNVVRIGRGAFSGSMIRKITIPASVGSIPDDAFWGCSRLEAIELPDAVTWIGDRAFRGCAALKSIALPTELRVLGDEAFFGCASLSRVVLPANLTEIYGAPFVDTTGLVAVDVATGNAAFKSRGGVLFSSAGLQLLLFPPAKETSEYAVPDGVATISVGAFRTPRFLTRLTIPESVTTIEDGAIDRRVRLVVKPNSFAHEWAVRNHRRFTTD